MDLNSAIAKTKIHFHFIISLLFAFFIFLGSSFSQINPKVDPMRDPNFNGKFNPLLNQQINPVFVSNINPKYNSSLNPATSVMLNPNMNALINPNSNAEINPVFTSDLNPDYNFNIRPHVNVFKYVYELESSNEMDNTKIKLGEKQFRFGGVLVKTNNENVFIYFDADDNYAGFVVSNGTGGFNFFSTQGDFVEVYLVKNGYGNFNLFDLTTKRWMGFTT